LEHGTRSTEPETRAPGKQKGRVCLWRSVSTVVLRLSVLLCFWRRWALPCGRCCGISFVSFTVRCVVFVVVLPLSYSAPPPELACRQTVCQHRAGGLRRTGSALDVRATPTKLCTHAIGEEFREVSSPAVHGQQLLFRTPTCCHIPFLIFHSSR